MVKTSLCSSSKYSWSQRLAIEVGLHSVSALYINELVARVNESIYAWLL